MTGMDGKKDPGKFTFRFNLCDPQQRRAAEFLNRQGRSKAQFIANAVLYYVDGQPSASQGAPSSPSNKASRNKRRQRRLLFRQTTIH